MIRKARRPTSFSFSQVVVVVVVVANVVVVAVAVVVVVVVGVVVIVVVNITHNNPEVPLARPVPDQQRTRAPQASIRRCGGSSDSSK